MDETAGQRRAGWRWRDHHTLSPYHSLGDVPLLGALFSREARPLTGYGETGRAEDNVPATHGSVVRMVAEMTDPPRVRMLIDAGNNGNRGVPTTTISATHGSGGTLCLGIRPHQA